MKRIIPAGIRTERETHVRIRTVPLRRLLLNALVLIAFLVLGSYCVISAIVAHDLIPARRHMMARTPASYGLKYEEVSFASAVDSVLLRGWFIDSAGTKTILLLHARDDAKDSEALLLISKALVEHNYDVLLFDMRAHGESGGTEFGLGQWSDRDIDGALAYLRGRGVTEVGVIGHSIGAGIALWAAPDRPAMRAIVADSGFADLSVKVRLTKVRLFYTPFIPGVYFMGQLLYGTAWATMVPENAMARMDNRPVFIIHGTVDQTVPVDNAYRLLKAGAINPRLQSWIVPNSNHLDVYFDHSEEYLVRILDFFDRSLAKQ